MTQGGEETGWVTADEYPVSYTHLDVYKRQGQGKCTGDGGAGTDSVPIHDGRLGGKTAENGTWRV